MKKACERGASIEIMILAGFWQVKKKGFCEIYNNQLDIIEDRYLLQRCFCRGFSGLLRP